MDITNFMSWFINQVVTMFTSIFNTLDSITFLGTSLLRLMVTLTILVPLIGVVLTIGGNVSVLSEKSEQVREGRLNKERNKKSDREGGRWV